jgi:hypothetical protein
MHLILLTSLIIATQPEASSSLYATEILWGKNGAANKINLVRVAFDKDQRLTKETLLQGGEGVFGSSFGTRILLEQRYVVTSSGGVIDVQTKKVLHDQRHGKLLGVDEGKVVYLVADIDMPNGFFSFDLKTHKVEKLENPGRWKLLGVKSPNQKMSVKQEVGGGPILLHHVDGTVDRLGEGFRVTYKKFASPHLGGLPFVWLDNERMLTQRGNGDLVLLDIKGKQEHLLDIEAEKEGTLSPPRLYRGFEGRIIYSANHTYAIDVKAKTATKLERAPLGHGFETSFKADDKQVRSIFHDGKEIGRWNVLTYQGRTMPGVIALPYAEPGGNLGYPKGIAVWHAKAGRWQTIDFAVGDVIDWGR